MKKTIHLLLTLSLSFFITTLQANEIRAGAISLKQLTALTVEATVNIVVPSHANVTALELCWGDGTCSSLQQSNEFINPANFQIETTILLLSNTELNTTPSFPNPQNLVDVDINTETLVLFGADEDVENDAYSHEICEPENVTNYSSINFPNSTLTLAPSGAGVLVWSNPGFEGVYIVQICTNETRNGQQISSSKRIVCFGVDNSFVSRTSELSNSEILIYPNPVSGGELYIERKGELVLEGSSFLIINALGASVFTSEWDGEDQMTINVRDLPKGYYTVVLLLKDGRRLYKQIVIS